MHAMRKLSLRHGMEKSVEACWGRFMPSIIALWCPTLVAALSKGDSSPLAWTTGIETLWRPSAGEAPHGRRPTPQLEDDPRPHHELRMDDKVRRATVLQTPLGTLQGRLSPSALCPREATMRRRTSPLRCPSPPPPCRCRIYALQLLHPDAPRCRPAPHHQGAPIPEPSHPPSPPLHPDPLLSPSHDTTLTPPRSRPLPSPPLTTKRKVRLISKQTSTSPKAKRLPIPSSFGILPSKQWGLTHFFRTVSRTMNAL